MSSKILINVRRNGECKLVGCEQNTKFSEFMCHVIGKWPDIQKSDFNFICSIGSYSNVSLECDDDLANLITLSSIVGSRIVNADLCSKPLSLSSLGTCTPSYNSHSPNRSNDQFNFQSITPEHYPSEGSGYNNNSSSIQVDGKYLEFEGNNGIPVFDMCPTVVKQSLLSDDWVNIMKDGVGAEFRGGAEHFRTGLIKYTVKTGFRFKFVKNNKQYIHAACVASNCDWFIKAKLHKFTKYFVVFKANLVHRCVGKLIGKDTKRLGPRLVGDFMLSEVKDNPNISGKSVLQKIKKSYGIDIPYWKAFRAAERAKSVVFGGFNDSYDELRWYCDAINRTNPGSVVDLQSNSENHQFERLFIAFKACIEGFRSCRPMLFIDGTFMKGRAKGTLLSATGKDGDNGLFPVAFAIISAENNENWIWFLQKIRDSIIHEKQIFYISDRHLGILNAFPNVFHEPVHFFCLYHLITNLKGRFSAGWPSKIRDKLVEQFRDCAYAPDTNIFNQKIDLFKKTVGKKAVEFLEQLPFEKWAFAYSPHISRYGEMTSNAAESFNKWILDSRSLPVTHMVEDIRSKISNWFVKRRDESSRWTGAFVQSKEDMWNRYIDAGLTWNVVVCPSGVFSVDSTPSVVVNLSDRTCSCFQWQIRGFPCVHAVAVIRVAADSVFPYVESCFFTSSYRDCYSSHIYPIPETEKYNYQPTGEQPRILPPSLKRPPRRPKKTRIPSFGEYRKRKKAACTRCYKTDRHDHLTCGMCIDEMISNLRGTTSYHPELSEDSDSFGDASNSRIPSTSSPTDDPWGLFGQHQH